MFDVVWTDPKVECVGERRARKQQERANPSYRGRSSKSSATSCRSSRRSSHDSSSDRLRSFFASTRNSKSSDRRIGTMSSGRTPSCQSTKSHHSIIDTSSRRNSLYNSSETVQVQQDPHTPNDPWVPSEYLENTQQSSNTSSRGTINNE